MFKVELHLHRWVFEDEGRRLHQNGLARRKIANEHAASRMQQQQPRSGRGKEAVHERTYRIERSCVLIVFYLIPDLGLEPVILYVRRSREKHVLAHVDGLPRMQRQSNQLS